MNAKVGAWTVVLAVGLIFLFSGIGDSGGNSQPGLIVFGALITSAGASGLLGLAHDPEGAGIAFGLLGFVIPGYSLPFLLYYGVKGVNERADYEARTRRWAAQERAEREAGLRCDHCGRLDEPGRHTHPRCPDFVHEVQVVAHDSGEWLLSSGAYIPPARTFSVRCSCGCESFEYSRREWAVDDFRARHGEAPVQIVPEVHA